MLIVPNNKLSNHYRKKKVEKTVWFEDQTVSSSFQQNLETIREHTGQGMFYEEYLNPNVSFSNNSCPNFYNAYPSMPNNDFNGSMINPYANNGIDGLNNFVGGDIRSLEENNSGGFVWEYVENGNNDNLSV